MNELLDIVEVTPHADGWMDLVFENGERRAYDMSRLFARRIYAPLRDARLFGRAYVENGTVNWPGEIDIDPETLYADSVRVQRQCEERG